MVAASVECVSISVDQFLWMVLLASMIARSLQQQQPYESKSCKEPACRVWLTLVSFRWITALDGIHVIINVVFCLGDGKDGRIRTATGPDHDRDRWRRLTLQVFSWGMLALKVLGMPQNHTLVAQSIDTC